jgi:NADH:ubiquinone oxidoreductase subunit E
VKIEVCHGQNCKPYGGKQLAKSLAEQGVHFEVIECRSLCQHAPVVFVDGKAKLKATMEDVNQ